MLRKEIKLGRGWGEFPEWGLSEDLAVRKGATDSIQGTGNRRCKGLRQSIPGGPGTRIRLMSWVGGSDVGLLSQCKDFSFYSKRNEEPLAGSDQRSDVFYLGAA